MTEEQATQSGDEIIAQLRSRRNSYYNRNKFYFRTDDTQAALIREYCEKNKISLSDLFKQLLFQHFNHA
jgi:hypothetical protein